jgi:hypothetical protein
MRKGLFTAAAVAATLALAPAAQAGGGFNGTANVFLSSDSAGLNQKIKIGGHHWGANGEMIDGSCEAVVVTLNSIKTGKALMSIATPKLTLDASGVASWDFFWRVKGPKGTADFSKFNITASQKCTDPDDDPYTLTAATRFRIRARGGHK